MTQPSVSAAVSALERELGLPLVDRSARPLHPTPAGALLLMAVPSLVESDRSWSYYP